MITIASGDHRKYATKLYNAILDLDETARVRDFPNERDKFIVRWGCVGGAPSEDAVVINPSIAIGRSSNKGHCRRLFKDAGVPIPKLVDPDNVTNFPVIGRPSFHQAGQGFFVCNTSTEVRSAIGDGASYFSEIFKHTHEYRVHCGHGRVLAVHNKDIAPQETPTGHFRDRYNWYLEYRRDVPRAILLAGLEATKAIKLDFAAVDVLWNNRTQKCAVLETNTAPSLDGDMILNKYAKYIIGLYKSWKEDEEGDKPKHKTFNEETVNLWTD